MDKDMTKKLITEIDYDHETNLPIVTDIRGNMHIVPWEAINKDTNSERHYLQSYVRGTTWSITSFSPIPDFNNPGKFLSYVVPNGKCFNISFILAAQSAGNNNMEVSCLALYVNTIRRAIIPFVSELDYVLFSPISVSPGSLVELKYMPFYKRCDLGVILGGPLIDCELS